MILFLTQSEAAMWNLENEEFFLSIISILVVVTLWADYHKKLKSFLKFCGLQKKPLSLADLAWQQRRPIFKEVHRRAMYHLEELRWEKYTLKYLSEDKKEYELSWFHDTKYVLYLRCIVQDLHIRPGALLENGQIRLLARLREEDPWLLVHNTEPFRVKYQPYQGLIDAAVAQLTKLNNLVSEKERSA